MGTKLYAKAPNLLTILKDSIMNIKNTHLSHYILGIGLLTLSACGGGSSSSESSNEASGVTSYSGSETVTLSSPGVPAFDATTAQLRIDLNGSNVIITNQNNFEFRGDVTNNSFTASGFASGISQDGVACAGATITYTGNINGEIITGSSRAELDCTVDGVRLPITYTSRFSVALTTR